MGLALGPGAGVNAFDRAVAAHRAAFRREPTFAAQAPGRVNLIGEHTDYNDGFVLPIAIDRRCYAVASRGKGSILATDLGDLWTISSTPPAGSWMSYAAGVIDGVQRLAGIPMPDLDITIASDVPLGAGLSSSAAFEVALALVLLASINASPNPSDVARLCRRAEHEYAGVPCGIMDQMIAVLAREGHALLIDCRDESSRPIAMPPPDQAAVVVMNTGVRHALASGEYAARRETCRRAAAALATASLRDAVPSAVLRLDPDLRECAMHVVLENARTQGAAKALEAGQLAVAGELMRGSHASLRDQYHVSCPELDTLVEAAATVPGVFGARMTGGGFGGCAVALVRSDAVEPLRTAVTSEYQRRHGRTPDVFAVSAAAGASEINVVRGSRGGLPRGTRK